MKIKQLSNSVDSQVVDHLNIRKQKKKIDLGRIYKLDVESLKIKWRP